MEIIRDILATWPDIEEAYNKSIETYNNNDTYYKESENDYEKLEKWIEEIEVVKEFMKFIEVPLEYLPFSKDEIEEEKWANGDKSSDALFELQASEDIMESYKSYKKRLEKLRWNNDTGAEYRGTEIHLVSDVEFYMDIYRLQNRVRLLLKDMINSHVSIDEEAKYKEILNIFNVNAMIEEGHSERDITLNQKKAELICAMCRVSWEWDYIKKWADEMERLLEKKANSEERKNAKKLFTEMQKRARKDVIFAEWKKDTLLVKINEDIDCDLYAIYRNQLSEVEEQKINKVIAAL